MCLPYPNELCMAVSKWTLVLGMIGISTIMATSSPDPMLQSAGTIMTMFLLAVFTVSYSRVDLPMASFVIQLLEVTAQIFWYPFTTIFGLIVLGMGAILLGTVSAVITHVLIGEYA